MLVLGMILHSNNILLLYFFCLFQIYYLLIILDWRKWSETGWDKYIIVVIQAKQNGNPYWQVNATNLFISEFKIGPDKIMSN